MSDENWSGSWCPQCGPDVSIDEDGCCAICGADATGEGAERALALREQRDTALRDLGAVRAELAAIKARRCGTCVYYRPAHQYVCVFGAPSSGQSWFCADWKGQS